MWKRLAVVTFLVMGCHTAFALFGEAFLPKLIGGISDKEMVARKEFSFPHHKSLNCSVRQYMRPVKNQGARSNCAVFATLAFIERYAGKTLSEECAIRFYRHKFTNRIRRYNTPFDIKYFQKHGVVSEDICPYSYNLESKDKSVLSKKEYKKLVDASNVNTSWLRPEFFQSEYRLEMMNYVRAKLEKGHPVVVGLTTPNFWAEFRDGKTGTIDIPSGPFLCGKKMVNKIGDCITMGHAIIITGYDDKRELLEFKNSWSRDWNDRGYGYMTYRYFQEATAGLIYSQNGVALKSSCH